MHTYLREDIDAIDRAYTMTHNRDLSGFLELVDENFAFIVSSHVPWGGRYEGRAGVTEFFGKITSHLDSKVYVNQYFDAGDHVVVATGHVVGTVVSNGRSVDLPVVHVWTMGGGKPKSVQVHLDIPSWLEALRA